MYITFYFFRFFLGGGRILLAPTRDCDVSALVLLRLSLRVMNYFELLQHFRLQGVVHMGARTLLEINLLCIT
jgi:hypothetical protein